MTELIVVFVTTLSAAVGFCVSPAELKRSLSAGESAGRLLDRTEGGCGEQVALRRLSVAFRPMPFNHASRGL
jgi:hypothetical protein